MKALAFSLILVLVVPLLALLMVSFFDFDLLYLL